ncbi:MAG: crotonase/enoyl-CoA hydratase family protein [Deltaproteobacteria bacterium]|nr:crotonase/enoyl-CoA hydratase family protein [Deltaproteobacteria bacterium]
MTAKVTYEELDDGVALIRMDDGKVNALGVGLIGEIDAALDRAEAAGRAVVLVGRAGKFSAGFDMKAMTGGVESATEMLVAGAKLLARIYGFPRPVVAACSGHAIAAGALLLLAADTRIGTGGPFKLGLNEVAIGLRLPYFGLELARDRLAKQHLQTAVLQAALVGPEDAVRMGYLDRVVDAEQLEAEAIATAAGLAALPPKAYAATKLRLRQSTIGLMTETLDADMDDIGNAFG